MVSVIYILLSYRHIGSWVLTRKKWSNYNRIANTGGVDIITGDYIYEKCKNTNQRCMLHSQQYKINLMVCLVRKYFKSHTSALWLCNVFVGIK